MKKKSTIIKYQFPTESSISGSPIFNEETKKIIGIHLGALNSEKFNVGNRINSKIVNEIK